MPQRDEILKRIENVQSELDKLKALFEQPEASAASRPPEDPGQPGGGG